MAAMFEFRTLRDIVAFPAKLVLGFSPAEFETGEKQDRPSLVLRWWRGKDGRLESRWERSE